MSPVAALAASEAEVLEPPALTEVVKEELEDPQPAINTPAAIGMSRNAPECDALRSGSGF